MAAMKAGICLVIAAAVLLIMGGATASKTVARRAPQPLTLDSFGDGMPDAMRLDDTADRERFRRWFTAISEMQFYYPNTAAAREVNDCAALARYAYHEALRRHGPEWRRNFASPVELAIDDVEKYSYPRTPLGAALFRTNEGKFAEFADAETLFRRNTHLAGRDAAAARKSDLLVFHQPGQKQPYHLMVFTGTSELLPDGVADYVVYHTGEDNSRPGIIKPGVIKKVPLSVLRRHPSARWRPVSENENFLGFYRWNILR